jgi:DNA-directed RNA polymerase subunit beta
VVFEESIHPNGTRLHSARIIPFRGSWVEFTVDINDVCFVHIDKKKKFPATALLRAFGWGSTDSIYRLFFEVKHITLKKEHFQPTSELVGLVIAEEVVDRETGEVVFELGSELTEEALAQLKRLGRKRLALYVSRTPSERGQTQLIKRTVQKDPTHSEDEALFAIYSLLRPVDAPNVETARDALHRVFFNAKRYDLGRVGRYKICQRLGLDVPLSTTVLTRDDFVAILKYLVDLNEGRGYTDDIDHLSITWGTGESAPSESSSRISSRSASPGWPDWFASGCRSTRIPRRSRSTTS